ncbi:MULTISPECIES: pyridoxamine 5'-phosphate oxidase family protein [unclassified Nocardia]|uniref:pyridoxamine 5'-phosphate oxidase family protein n=1 Tax=unclassified Nocardia TaxID=2637762 RepID=UPI0024A96492|nr:MULTISPECIES: pyridoxamine 5'-phosphate oxidase family protein [unclassified Nocardia]
MSNQLFATTREMLRTTPYGFLSTSAAGRVHTRLVQHAGVDADGTIWIGTSPASRKAADIARSPEVTYAVEDRAAYAYACVYATATVVDDLEERKARWVNGFDMFFPDGPEGDDFVLLRLRPTAVEVMDFTREIHPDPYGLVPARAERSH